MRFDTDVCGRWARWIGAAGAAAALISVASCAQGKATGARLPEITGKDLKRVTVETARVDPTLEQAPIIRIGPVEASRGIDDVETYVGAPVTTPPAPTAAVEPAPSAAPEPVAMAEEGAQSPPRAWSEAPAAPEGGALVDAMVGQINGRPVFASEFFGPMDARLRAESRTARPAEWVRSAQQQIRAALFEKMRDELLLAEFQASLNAQQRLGVLAFVETLRSNLVSENFGSEELAKRRLMEEEGVTIEQKIEAQRDRELIRAQIMKVLNSRAYVPWREVVLAYERDINEYTPPAKATLRMIRVPAADVEAASRVQEALAAGEPFADVASRESSFNSSSGGLYEVTIKEADFTKATIFGDETLNTRARALTVGQVDGPFESGSNTTWLKLESVDRPPTKTLYDEQLAIHSELRSRRLQEEEQKYFEQLIERASMSNLDEMERRLMQIAVDRYFPSVAGSGR